MLAALRGHPDAATFRARRDALYLVEDPEAREAAFRALHAAWFERLGLGRPIPQAIEEQPELGERLARCVVATAPARRDEGADLFVAGDDGRAEPERRTLLLRLRPETLARPDGILLALLRRELLHVADLTDPRFGFTPGMPGAATFPDRLLRERYRVLWTVSVDGRLERRGWLTPRLGAQHFREFVETFPMLGAGVEAAFERLRAGADSTHADLLAAARAPEQLLGGGRRGPHPGDRCALCACATHDFEPAPAQLSPAVRAQIRRDRPGWTPADGLCRQCADLYRARTRDDAPAPGGAGTRSASRR